MIRLHRSPAHLVTLLSALALTIGMLLSSPGVPVQAGTEVICFRILHASPDAPNLDVFVQNTRVARNLAYTKFSRTWHLAPGSIRVRVYATPGDQNAQAYRDIQINLDLLDPGLCYLIVIGNTNAAMEIFTFPDPPVPPAGQFTIRLANLAPNAPPLDLTKSDGTPLIGNVPFKSATPSNYPPGSYSLQIKQTGTGTVLLDLGTQTFRSRTRQTVYVFDAGGPQPNVRPQSAQAAPRVLICDEHERICRPH